MKKHSTCTTFRDVICAALAFLMMMALPTGCLYDLWAGSGTEQGQRPGGGVEQLQRWEDVEPAFLAKAPSTVSGGELAACPLARLRDVGQEGIHDHHNGGTKRTILSRPGNMRSSESRQVVPITDAI